MSSKQSRSEGRSSATRPQPPAGAVEWFRIGDHEKVDRVLADLKRLGLSHLKTGISWADVHTPEGDAWYAWLFPQLSRHVNLLPCFCHTPPSVGIAPKPSSPPTLLRSYADFLDVMITRFGRHFEYMELWNEPNNVRGWDLTLDPYWFKFSEMVGGAAYWCKHRGKKTVLGGMRPIDPNWLKLMSERGVIQYIDAVGIHGYPVTFENTWEGWEPQVGRIREVLEQANSQAEVWITETGYSTWRHDERRQLTAFVDALNAPVERVYWHSLHDLDPTQPTGDGYHTDEREYHFGLRRSDGGEKLLSRIWAEGGIRAVRDAYWLGRSSANGEEEKPVLITGGCGFIGTNLAHRILSTGQPVLVYDNLSRPGVERNLRWLRETHGDLLQVEVADVQDTQLLRSAVRRACKVFHFAAQVAVTTSLSNPIHDFEVNARGTLNLLEAIRAMDDVLPLVFTSTNKVYGGLPDLKLRKNGSRYEPADDHTRDNGISESRPLDFHSPYGCSKGTADQFVIDYARTFGQPAVVFRMSCIYGPHQFGNEDQGWVAHFLIRALQGQPITIYGDGMQVRDILFAEDLVDAFLLAQANISRLSGTAFNIGGGAANTVSLLELMEMIEQIHGKTPQVRMGAWRPGDQRYYVSDTTRFREATGWKPKVSPQEGVRRLYDWLRDNTIAAAPRSVSKRRPGLDSRWPSNGKGKRVAARHGRISAKEVL